MPEEIVIHDGNAHLYIEPPTGRMKGLKPRNFDTHPLCFAKASRPLDLPSIPVDQQQSILDAMVASKSRLSDIRMTGMGGKMIPSRDQNGKGYCWAHSSTSASLLVRARDNDQYADLSAFAVACIIKGYRDEGGFGAESLQWIADNGIPTSKFWAQQSMSKSNDNPAMRADAALHKITDWYDLDPRNVEQLKTCLLNRIPVVCDFNWWGHSVCAADIVSINPFSIRIWNSWGDSWSQNGMGVLSGSKAIPDSMIAPVMGMASPA